VNIFKNKKPYFSKEKFLKNSSRYIKSERNKEHYNNMMIQLLKDDDAWFTTMDGKELIQISKDEFTFKKKIKIFHPSIPIYWVEWR
jgi:hypothetical protein